MGEIHEAPEREFRGFVVQRVLRLRHDGHQVLQ